MGIHIYIFDARVSRSRSTRVVTWRPLGFIQHGGEAVYDVGTASFPSLFGRCVMCSFRLGVKEAGVAFSGSAERHQQTSEQGAWIMDILRFRSCGVCRRRLAAAISGGCYIHGSVVIIGKGYCLSMYQPTVVVGATVGSIVCYVFECRRTGGLLSSVPVLFGTGD